ncbi:MAG: ribonuclease III [Elusimicrobiales bacterium]
MFFNNYKELEDKIGYSFKDKKLLDKALTHKSYSVERKMVYHNERLEFLGDSVVGLIVSEHLLKKYLDKDEGFLSKMKSYIVSSKNLYRWAKIIELDKYIKLSKAETLMGGKSKQQILANAFEAVVGAMYMDGDFENAKKFISGLLEANHYAPILDYKSHIQEYSQKKYKTLPHYKLISQTGPDHKKNFVVALYLNNQYICEGEGQSKKEAEQNAAKKAAEKLHINNIK